MSAIDEMGVGKFRADDDGTQRAAAVSIFGRSGSDRRAVYRVIFGRGTTGATDEEIQDILHMNPNTQRPRRIELCNKGVIRKNGYRRTRSNRNAKVWIAVDPDATGE